MDKIRTLAQNRSLHKYFSEVANSLIEHGKTVGDVLEIFNQDDVSPTGDTIKEIWKSILKRKHGKTSTTEMTTQDLNDVLEEFNLKLGYLIDETIDFPSIEVQKLIEYYNKII